MKKRNLIAAAVAIACVSSFTVASSLAYLSDRDQASNKFTFAELTIDLTEPAFPSTDSDRDGVPNAGQDLYQLETRAKDPAITNTSQIPAWVFLKVTVPTFRGRYAAERAVTTKQLFSFTASSNWTKLHEENVGASPFGSITYYYGYKTKLAPGQKTTPLFNSVTFADVVEGEIRDTEKLRIGVEAYGIQTTGIPTLNKAYDVFDWSRK